MLELLLAEPGQLVLHAQSEPLPTPEPDEVRIRALYGGICGSDVKVYKGQLAHAKYPVRAGHELLGQVVEVGDGVSLSPGVRVVVNPNTYCGECGPCRRGRTNLCLHKGSLGINQPGVFAEEIILPFKYVLPVPPEVPDMAAVLTEPLAVATRALKRAGVRATSRVLVIGCGSEGTLCTLLARQRTEHVAVADVRADRLEWIESLVPGVDANVPEAYPDNSFSVVIEAAGHPAAVQQSLRLVEPGGVVVLIGLAQEAVLPVQQFVRKEVAMFGSIIYVAEDLEESVESLRDLRLQNMLARLIGTEVPFVEFRDAYAYAMSGRPGKALLRWSEKT
ncbi:MAG: alcohol dehydrogenase catalytic domain-containing protein [Alicyclobacillus herbarius]|uniref:zinc-dependent alcohol dehydrogenase n=1 Tax=Alicyclobacillus herbarius TaxID=122960 RepID=UPI002352FDD1|nr:alcohol dehydrogenase catalytic domain-containing protein [Alicyclobacillus herbarius]MCL6632139.1 alcohol dehydrogenase catalytic domain-containing protein [Alicyclobacillus herbarius]